ncbi:MAG: YiiX/YebB-like N1pC/P60 family cysteine hydrolase [Nitratireductor sp.]
MLWRAVALLGVMLPLSACQTLSKYYLASDAPEPVKAGSVDPRLDLTRKLGAQLSPVIRKMAAPYGRLHHATGFEQELRSILRPLDILIVRSRPALTRLAFPSHFTHAEVWLGTPEQMRALGAFLIPSVAKHRGEIMAGKSVLEAANDDVHLSGFDQISNTDEVVVLRPVGLTQVDARYKFSALFKQLGEPFDYNFDYSDTSRLTCMEVVKAAYPELGIPVRYTAGRYAVIPDDIVRRGLTPGSGLRFVAYFSGKGFDGYQVRGADAVAAMISQPAPKPKYRISY